jgi:hypothetical protein
MTLGRCSVRSRLGDKAPTLRIWQVHVSDPFQATRAALAAARLALEAGQATNKDFQTTSWLVEERLTPGHKHYDGDAPGAVQSLRQLLANLVALKAAPKATTQSSLSKSCDNLSSIRVPRITVWSRGQPRAQVLADLYQLSRACWPVTGVARSV